MSTTNNVVQLDLLRHEHEKIKCSRELADMVDAWCAQGRVSRAQAKEFREVMCTIIRTTNQQS